MRTQLLPFSRPLIGEEEIAEVINTLRSDWITTGPKVKRFEHEFACRVDAPAALALNSCTAALHLALLTLGVGPGDAVITTPLTFCSDVHVIEHTGARPILVDVDPLTLQLDVEKIAETVEKLSTGRQSEGRVKALLPVHLYGHPCDLDPILKIARQYDLAVVEDAAHALPAKYKGRTIGSHATSIGVPSLTCFSFYATKNLTTAEGGMLTGLPELVEEARIWSLHGMSRDSWKRYSGEGSWYYEVIRPGFKYNMTDLQAAIGIHQLRKLGRFHARRTEIARRYTAAFSHFTELETPFESLDVEHGWHLYVLRLRAEQLRVSRNLFIEELRARNIAASVHFIPIHLHPYYRDKYGYRPEHFPVALREYERMVSLPLHPGMSERDVDDVIEVVTAVVVKYRKRARNQRPQAMAACVTV